MSAAFSKLPKYMPVFVASCLLFFPSTTAGADPELDAGIRHFRAKNFAKALPFLQQAVRLNPSDPNAIYYEAACYQCLGDMSRAAKLYAILVQNYPHSEAGKLAYVAGCRIDPRFGRLHQMPGSERSRVVAPANGNDPMDAQDQDRLPLEARIPYQKEGSEIAVQAKINGQSLPGTFPMYVHTGAECTVFGKNHLTELGIPVPVGAPIADAVDISGKAETVKLWTTYINLRIENIERRHFPILVQEDLNTRPLLGQNFFKDFTYTVDPTANSIHLLRRGRTAAAAVAQSKDSHIVPFNRLGSEITVDVEVNGKKVPMVFSTGIANIVFTQQQIKDAGIVIPADAPITYSTGLADVLSGIQVRVPHMRLGPIDKHDLTVVVIANSNLVYPLLGQQFLGEGWQFTIDNEHSTIHFVRR